MDKREVLILFGSQTGTVEDVALRLWRELKRHRWSCVMLPMDKYSLEKLPDETLVLFICSTTGQGQEPDNMRLFWKWIMRSTLPSNMLMHVQMAVLGLGDSSYSKFNFVAKLLHKRLLQLGASSLVQIGLADDQHDHGPEAVVGPWITSLLAKLEESFPLPSHEKLLEDNELFKPLYEIKISGKTSKPTIATPWGDFNAPIKDPPILGIVASNKRLTSIDHFQAVHLTRIRCPDIKYSPGDVLQIQPLNSAENVDNFLNVLNLDPLSSVQILPSDDMSLILLPPMWQTPDNVTDLAYKTLDLQAVPSKYALEVLAHFSPSELERNRLLELCSPEGHDDYVNYCIRPKRTILEVLHDFHESTAALPVTHLLEVFKVIRPRSFSIASSNEVLNNAVEILVAVVKYRTKLVTPRLGLCSNYLANLKNDDEVHVWIRNGSFSFPHVSRPIILVGPGTGCAPFRSLIHQRSTIDGLKRTVLLFLGFRNENKDFLVQHEWQEFEKSGLIKLFTAFSRDQPSKIYVQDRLLEQAKLVWQLIFEEQASFFVAGNAKEMPRGVRDAVIAIACQEQNFSSEEAQSYVENMEKTGRYQTETWS